MSYLLSLPKSVKVAESEIGLKLGLNHEWLNDHPASFLEFDLPDGWEGRALAGIPLIFQDNLIVYSLARLDLIFSKLQAFRFAEFAGRGDVDLQDLKLLQVSDEELKYCVRSLAGADQNLTFSRAMESAREFIENKVILKLRG